MNSPYTNPGKPSRRSYEPIRQDYAEPTREDISWLGVAACCLVTFVVGVAVGVAW